MKQILQWAMPAIQTVISAFLVYLLVSSGLLPGKFLGIAIAVVAVLLVITLLFARSKSVATRSLGNILAIFMSGMLVFAVVYVQHIMKTLDQIAGTDTQIESMVVVVEKSNAAQEIGDTAGYLFGVYEGANAELLDVVGRSMQTSFTTSQITDVISWQLETTHGWDIGRQSVSGEGDSQQTFSMRGTDLYVMWPDDEQVSAAAERIKEVME